MRKKRKSVVKRLFLLFLTLLLCACQTTPETAAVISKNDGAFDANAAVSASETHAPDATQAVQDDSTFTSTDGSVEFSFALDSSVTDADMPVVRVAPHYLTGEDIKRTAEALFPGADFREAYPTMAEVLSKEVIQRRLERWTPYTTLSTLQTLLSNSTEETLEIVQSFVEEYTAAYASAPDEYEYPACQWEFKKWVYYFWDEEEAKTYDTDEENDAICATTWVDGIPYRITAETRNRSDYKINFILAQIDDGTSPDDIDAAIFDRQLMAVDEPDEVCLEELQEKAAETLAQMGLGEWKVDSCTVFEQTPGDTVEYGVRITAVPVFSGIPAAREEQPTLGEEYAPNYYLADATFVYAPGGELKEFELTAPVDIVSAVNDNVQVMTMDALLERAKEALELSDWQTFAPSESSSLADRDITCMVVISNVEYSLHRIRVEDTDADYYYIPGIRFLGTVTLYDAETQGVLYQAEEPTALVTINAVDGTILGWLA